MLLSGKRIILGVTGGIAAYKAAHLTRLLIKEGAEVKVIMTTSALDFIRPLTLATLSKGPVYHQFFDEPTGEWNDHVSLGLWADVFLIAPLTASTLAKLANGQSDNLLCATYLSAKCPVMIAPAMDLDMYRHPAVRSNFEKLKEFGNLILEARYGELASGLVGHGRMAEPEAIMEALHFLFDKKRSLSGKKMMITAGPTQEAMDPVRYISNHSSGKMGIAIAEEAFKRGAEVTLVLGPTALRPKYDEILIIPVISAEEMFEKAASLHEKMDIVVFSAAVADYRPAKIYNEKIKKSDELLSITLVKNRDIARSLGQMKRNDQVHIGFALETEEGLESAQNKLQHKGFDFIVLNSLKDPGAGFQKDTNQVTFLFHHKAPFKTQVISKNEVAELILKELEILTNKTESK
ncbi:MAG: bifunctional phosphopantothenoylcysteine decarboxylase/phosphopantothenate--cysteine ligase CoaBC [Cyclobacteriaceae bacterium]